MSARVPRRDIAQGTCTCPVCAAPILQCRCEGDVIDVQGYVCARSLLSLGDELEDMRQRTDARRAQKRRTAA